jgi:lysophospholipase L1-like esterase
MPGQAGLELKGDSLLAGLQLEAMEVTPAGEGLQLSRQTLRQPRFLVNTAALAPANWLKSLPLLENGLIVLYLSAGGAILFGGLTRFGPPAALANLAMMLGAAIIAIGLGEAGLRIYLPPPQDYFVWEPNLRVVFNPAPGIMPGVEGEKRFITNVDGIRGAELTRTDDYHILTVGGSTTECLFLDQTETWPHLLQENLNSRQTAQKVWVGNVGRSGHTTREHILQVKYLLQQHPELDAVLLLVGANDLALRLEQGQAYQPSYVDLPEAQDALMRRAFRIFPKTSPYLHFYQQTAVWRLVDQIRAAQAQAGATKQIEVVDLTGEYLISAGLNRRNSPVENTLPDLSLSLAEYRRNLNHLIDIVQAHQVRPILLTQPTMWRSDLSPAEQDLLCFGWGGIERQNYFYAVEALAEGMARYNQALLEICRQRQVECIDLANRLPKDTTVFYDDMHFNESGAVKVADVVADSLLNDAPFNASRSQ